MNTITNNQGFYTKYFNDIMLMARMAKIDMSVARSVFFTAATNGKFSTGDEDHIQKAMHYAFSEQDIKDAHQLLKIMSGGELEKDRLIFNEMVAKYYDSLNKTDDQDVETEV